MNILITGHTGFLGKHVVRELLDDGHYIYAISRSSFKLEKEVFQYQIDICDKDKIQKILSEKNIDIVIHLCGKSAVRDCENDPFGAFMTNSLGTVSVLDACRLAKVPKIISVETDKVYGLQNEASVNEDSSLNPITPYDMSKVLAADLSNFYRKYYKMNIVSVRPVNLIGGDDPNSTRILPAAFKNIFNQQPIIIFKGSESSQRDFVYVKDAAKAIVLLATKDTKHHVYNISSSSSITIKEFVDKVLNVTGCNIVPEIRYKNATFNEIDYQSICGSRFVDEFDFKFTPLENVIYESYQQFLSKQK